MNDELKIEKDVPMNQLPNPEPVKSQESLQQGYPQQMPGYPTSGYPQQPGYPPVDQVQAMGQVVIIPILIPMGGITQPVALPPQVIAPQGQGQMNASQMNLDGSEESFHLPIPIPIPTPVPAPYNPGYGYPPPPYGPGYGYPPYGNGYGHGGHHGPGGHHGGGWGMNPGMGGHHKP